MTLVYTKVNETDRLALVRPAPGLPARRFGNGSPGLAARRPGTAIAGASRYGVARTWRFENFQPFGG
jgi:hypothetical protein